MHRKTVSILAAASLVGGLLAAIVAGPAQAQTSPPVAVTNFNPADNASFPNSAFDPARADQLEDTSLYTECTAGFDPGFANCTTDAQGHDFADQLSDRFDGTDSLAHLTTVATQDADRVEWYVCGSAITGTGNPLTQQELTENCTAIGTIDTTGRTVPGGNIAAPTGEAYDTTWDIPASLDRTIRDIAALACAGAGTRLTTVSGQPANCRADVEDDISLDDAGTTTPGQLGITSPQPAEEQTNTAEIVSICTSDPDFGDATELCEESSVPGDQTREQLDARFREFPHGSPVPNDGFVIRVTVSENTDDLQAALLANSGASGIRADLIATDDCTRVDDRPTFDLYQCDFEPDYTGEGGGGAVGGVPDNREMDLVVHTVDNEGTGFCDNAENTAFFDNEGANTVGGIDDDPDGFDESDCQLDAHYVVSSARQGQVAQASFEPNNATGSPSSTAGTPACDSGETQDKEETNGILAPAGAGNAFENGAQEFVVACFVDQFGDRVNGFRVTFESTGPVAAQIFDCGPGSAAATDEGASAGFPIAGAATLHDHNGDGLNEHCHTVTNTDGEAIALINNITVGANVSRPGAQVVTACLDPQFNTTDTSAAAQPPGHGCTDAAANQKDTVTKNYLAVPQHIHLVWAGTGTTADPCHTGNTFKENTIGQSDTVLACTFDANNNPATTAQTGGGRLQWTLTVSTGQIQQATRFAADPPAETDANGRATAQIQAVNEGTDFITATLFSDSGGLQGACGGAPAGPANPCTATVQKRVRRPGETQPPTTQPGTTTPGPTTTSTTTVTTNPSPSATLNPRTVTLEVAKSRVTFGREASLSGGVSSPVSACIGNQTVVIRRTVAGSSTSQVFATLTTNADGTFSHSFDADVSANYIAHLDATANCAEANSDPAPVNVRVAVNLRVSKQIVRRGGTVRLNAQVLPCGNHAGTRVILFQLIAGDFVKVDRATLSGNCTASFSKTIRRNTAFQARWPKQDDDHLAGRSRKKAVRVSR